MSALPLDSPGEKGGDVALEDPAEYEFGELVDSDQDGTRNSSSQLMTARQRMLVKCNRDKALAIKGKAKAKGHGKSPQKSHASLTDTAASSVCSSKVSKSDLKLKAKGSVKGGKDKKHCKACGLYWEADVFDANDPYCPVDSPGIKRLQRSAKTESEKTQFKAIKSEPLRLQKLMAKYHETVGATGSVSHRMPQWVWAQYEEYEKCEQQVRKRKLGSMMHEERTH